MLEWSEIKSGRILTGEGEIHDLLNAADRLDSGQSPEVFNDKDNGCRVRKVVDMANAKAIQLPGVSELARLAGLAGIDWRDEYATRVVPYIASDERVDRHGDIVRQNWDFGAFATNPVLCWCHDWGAPPVGNAISWNIQQVRVPDYSGPALVLMNLFATAEEWPWADTIFRLVSSGFLKASSVGFYPREIMYVEDQDERNKLGLGRYGVVFNRSELVEHSPCTVPANPGALSQLRSAKQKGLLAPHDIEAIRELTREQITRGPGDSALWRSLDAQWRTTWNAVFPGYKARDHDELDIPIALDAPEGTEDRLVAMVASFEKRLEEIDSKLGKVADDSATISSAQDEIMSLVADIKSYAERIKSAASAESVEEPAPQPKSPLSEVMQDSVAKIAALLGT